MAVVISHERFDRGLVIGVDQIAEAHGDFAHRIVLQNILADVVGEVELTAKTQVEAISVLEIPHLHGGKPTLLQKRLEGVSPMVEVLDPENALNVTKAADSFLHVRLDDIDRALRILQRLAQEIQLAPGKSRSLSSAITVQCTSEKPVMEPLASGEESGFEHRVRRGQVALHELVALLRSPNRVP